MAKDRGTPGDGRVQEQEPTQGDGSVNGSQQQLPRTSIEAEHRNDSSRCGVHDGSTIATTCNSEREQDEDQEEHSEVNKRLQEDRNATDMAMAKSRGRPTDGIGRDVDNVIQPENSME